MTRTNAFSRLFSTALMGVSAAALIVLAFSQSASPFSG